MIQAKVIRNVRDWYCEEILSSSATEKIQRINDSNTENLYSLKRYSLMFQQQQPSLSICILTRLTPNIYDYGSYSYFIQSFYAALHPHYRIFPLYEDSNQSDYQYHRKLVPILELLNSEDGVDCDYVVWMDADLIPLDLNFSIESIIVEHPSGHLYLSEDVSTMVNTGCMIIRNSFWVKQFLTQWLAAKDLPDLFNEQMGFTYVYNLLKDHIKYSSILSERIIILPIFRLNSEAPAMWKQLPSHQILHLAAETNEYRLAVFQSAVLEICKNKQWLPQLGLSRRKLQQISIDINRRLVNEFELKLEQVHSLFLLNSSDIQQYRTTVSKYCHALAYHERELAGDENCPMIKDSTKICPRTNPNANHVESRDIISKRIKGYQNLRSIIEGLLLTICFLPSVFNTSANQNSEIKQKIDNIFCNHHQQGNRLIHSLSLHSLFLSGDGLDKVYELFTSLLQKKVLEIYDRLVSLSCDQLKKPIDISLNRIYTLYKDFPEMTKLSIELSYETLYILILNRSQGFDAIIQEIKTYLDFIFMVLLKLLSGSPQQSLIFNMYQEYEEYVERIGLTVR